MNQPTKQEKIEALMNANRRLDYETACRLLGYNPNDPELKKPHNSFEEMLRGAEDLFKGVRR